MAKRLKTLILMTLALSLILSSFPTVMAEDKSTAVYTPGTYTGVGIGRNKALTVSVTVDENTIKEIQVVDHGETPIVGDAAIEAIPARIIELQGLGVDTVSGATMTSNAIISAVSKALEEAGGDVAALKKIKPEPHEAVHSDMDADLIIVGAGATGAFMAVSAAEADPNLKIVLLEKNAYIGGNAVVSGGYIGVNNPPAEIACKMFDGANEMVEQRLHVEPVDEFSAELLEKAKQAFEEFKKGDQTYIFMNEELDALYSYLEFPIPYTHKLYLDCFKYVDDVFYWFYNRGAKFAPLLGVAGYAYPDSTYLEDYYSGAGYFEYLGQAIKESSNITLMTETAATKIYNENGTVTGVEATAVNGDTYTIHAPTTVLAYGGFAADPQRVKETDTYFGDLMPERLLTDNLSSTNSQSIDMAIDAGIAVDYLGFSQLFPFGNPLTGECHDLVGMDGILVNKDGKRTVDESSDRQTLSKAIFSEEDKVMYLISDAAISWIEDGVNMFGQDVQTMLDRKFLFKADTLEELADITGINKENLLATVEAYNAAANGEVADETGRITNDGPFTEGPYYAQPRTAVSHITYGGVIRNDDMQCLDKDGNVINGVYAVGDATINSGGIAMMESARLAKQLYGTEE